MKATDDRKEDLLLALEKSLGVVTTACKSVNIHRDTHYAWMKSDKEYRKRVKDIENISLDFAESALYKKMHEGNTSSIIFYLKCKGKKRGYIEDEELKVRGNMKFRADFGESNTIHPPSESTDNPRLDQ